MEHDLLYTPSQNLYPFYIYIDAQTSDAQRDTIWISIVVLTQLEAAKVFNRFILNSQNIKINIPLINFIEIEQT